VCNYEFNPLIERTKLRTVQIQALILEECDEQTFNSAREEVALLLTNF
jgi:hypothetical protein